jgi:pimeloyl-ACP methyl ester carboxylesterase
LGPKYEVCHTAILAPAPERAPRSCHGAPSFADHGGRVHGARPDLAGDAISLVTAPTLLIVGSRDTEVIELNRIVYERLPKELVIVEGAAHLFEKPGTVDQVRRHATRWFCRRGGCLNAVSETALHRPP